MKLKIDVRLDYAVEELTTILLQIEAAALADQRILDAKLDIRTPESFSRIPGEDLVGERAWVRVRDRLRCHYQATVEIDRPEIDLATLRQVPTHEVPGDVVCYLMDSRYVPAQMFQGFVDKEFEGLSGGARAIAIRDWVKGALSYVPGSSDEKTTAVETFVGRQGICRDYAHLVVALARASQIPARMASVYAPGVEPPDFHAVAEVYLDGHWHLLDATGMAGPASIARIGVGRDAADIPFLLGYGNVEMKEQKVAVSEA